MAINVILLLLAFLSAIVSIGGETWDKRRRSVTGRGWCAIVVFILALAFGIWKEYRSADERKQASADQRSLRMQLRETKERLGAILSDVQFTRARLGEAIDALARIANSPPAPAPLAAREALDELFRLKSSAVVKVKAVIGEELREKSGFFVNADGDVLTADFAVAARDGSRVASQVMVETADGRTFPAEIRLMSSDLSIAVLKTSVVSSAFLRLDGHPPVVGEPILTLGMTPKEFLTRSRGTVAKVDDVEVVYSRDRVALPGFGGGPVLRPGGLVVGINWGALEPPVPGSAKFVRSDRVLAHLREEGISGLSSD